MKYILEIEDQGEGIVTLVVSQDPPAPEGEATLIEDTLAGIVTQIAIDTTMGAIDAAQNIVTNKDDTTTN